MDIFGVFSLSGLHHKWRSGRALKRGAPLFLLVATLVLNPISVHATQAVSDHLSAGYEAFEAPFGLHNAGNWGVFNIGNSHGNVRHVQDDLAGKSVWDFSYVIPEGTHVGVWTQQYPPDLNRDSVDAVRIGVRVPEGEAGRAAVRIEIKGDKDMQLIPLELQEGWNFARDTINWELIGELQEVVFVLGPITQEDGPEIARGSMRFDVDFYPLSFFDKYYMPSRIAIALLAAIALALLIRVMAGIVGYERLYGRTSYLKDDTHAPISDRIKRDLYYAVGIVLTVGAAIHIHGLGARAFLDTGFSFDFVAVGLVGVLIANMWSVKFTGRYLLPTQVLQNFIISALIAASSTRQDFFQVPASWWQIFEVTNVTATVAFLLYHFGNAYALGSTHKHIRPATGALFACTPFLFGWLLAVQNMELYSALTTALSLDASVHAELIQRVLGRTFILFVFNVLLANAIGLITTGRLLKGAKAFATLAFVSIGVVLAPEVADLGSSQVVAGYPLLPRAAIAILTTMFAFAGLWGQVYLITGLLLDAGKRRAPTAELIYNHVQSGVKKGLLYSLILLGLLYLVHITITNPFFLSMVRASPLLIGILGGALVFPLLKTIVESFDGSLPFFQRLAHSYKNWVLYARGVIAGFGFAYAISEGIFDAGVGERVRFGLLIGLLASTGVSILRDAFYAARGQGRIQTWKMYLTDGCMGVFIGGGLAFYLDARQVPVIVEKFQWYVSSGLSPEEYVTYPLINRWGRIDLGQYTGGARLLFTESLSGVINWSVAAWLFALNKVFMKAYFDKDTHPIRFFFSRAGFAELMEHMIFVLRWGLWMSPIIFTFLRMMPEATWYNQDGAIRTVVATYQNFALSSDEFQAWSVRVFIYLLAFDSLRILIWMDHMGLRVATLVNLSFLGLDRLDEKVSRFIGPAAAQRYIPEGVKRFATWAPLLIPFYIPRGEEWDYAWYSAIALRNAQGPGLMARLQGMDTPRTALTAVGAVVAVALITSVVCALQRRARRKQMSSISIGNNAYKVIVRENGEIFSQLDHQKPGVYPLEYDLTRRAYDPLHPSGRILFVAEGNSNAQREPRVWPVTGNFPTDRFHASHIEKGEDALHIHNVTNGVKTTVDIGLAGKQRAEIWTVTLENMTDDTRSLKVVPYLEWVLNGGLHDRFHTQYARLFPEMEYMEDLNALMAWQKSTSSMGILASDTAPDGFHNARVDFIGRARSIWNPRILESFAFLPPVDTAPYPTFDPIGSLVISATVPANDRMTVKFLIGYATNRQNAIELVKNHLTRRSTRSETAIKETDRSLLIGHGEIPEGTPQPYTTFADGGNTLQVHTPFTPRPFDHAMTNAGGHSVMVTNRGLHTSCNVNSQQNRLTPDWADTTTKEVPTETIYLYDVDTREWFAPTQEPLRDPQARNTCEFSVNGTAVFHMQKDSLETELTVFVPRQDPTGIYLLKIRNNGDTTRNLRVSPYFQMVLAINPEETGRLAVCLDESRDALFFHNPRNATRDGWAFASMSHPAEQMETRRSRYFGSGRSVERPYMVEHGVGAASCHLNTGYVAGFITTVAIPPGGEETVAVVMGQTDTRADAVRVVEKYKNLHTVQESLNETTAWWLNLMDTAKLKTSEDQFNHLLNWLKYQALAERIWARRGFYQTSGAFGYRDQLQDTVNLIWVDPALARRQIILHAKHQFLEGDTYHWFFTQNDGRTGFACRSHASDNLLWLVWATAEYLQATGDQSLLDETATYAYSEFPFAKLPKMKEGVGHIYHRSTRSESIYRHCLRSIDCVLEKRMGMHGLPLIQTGDWNDGLDEIGSEGKGESVWLGFFLHYGLSRMLTVIEARDGAERKAYYDKRLHALKDAIEATWRNDRYLRAFHDDGTEIGIEGSGMWETDALTAAWAVFSGINPEREEIVFNTALRVLERDTTVLLGWPALREDSKPYLGRSSKYPEGVRENGMYCHGVQWLVRAARILAERAEQRGDPIKAAEYREAAYRLWLKITPVIHTTPEEIETYGGQPNKQQADVLTTYDCGRMIWNGYTGAAGWLLRQAFEGVVGAVIRENQVLLPLDMDKPRGALKVQEITRDISRSPLEEVL